MSVADETLKKLYTWEYREMRIKIKHKISWEVLSCWVDFITNEMDNRDCMISNKSNNIFWRTKYWVEKKKYTTMTTAIVAIEDVVKKKWYRVIDLYVADQELIVFKKLYKKINFNM
jgi:hypothetical protein